MTTEELYRVFRSVYKEPSTRYYDNEWAVDLINDSVEDIALDLVTADPEFFGVATASLGSPSANGGFVLGEQEYELPANFRKVVAVSVVDTRSSPPYPYLTQIPYRLKDRDAFGDWVSGLSAGEPSHYYVYQPQGSTRVRVGFVPIPGRNGSANGVRVEYHASRVPVTAINAANVPDLPIDFHSLIPWRMAMNAAALDETPRFMYYQANYQGRLVRLLGEALRSRGGDNERVEVVDYD